LNESFLAASASEKEVIPDTFLTINDYTITRHDQVMKDAVLECNLPSTRFRKLSLLTDGCYVALTQHYGSVPHACKRCAKEAASLLVPPSDGSAASTAQSRKRPRDYEIPVYGTPARLAAHMNRKHGIAIVNAVREILPELTSAQQRAVAERARSRKHHPKQAPGRPPVDPTLYDKLHRACEYLPPMGLPGNLQELTNFLTSTSISFHYRLFVISSIPSFVGQLDE
jgi:hypothetical protein